jgi:4a-hydroxytetrahydrobiopterin dehydratase
MVGMAELLSDDAINEALEHLPDWTRNGDALERDAKLESFPQAIQVVNRVAEIAENENHHPDIDIRWRTLTFRLSTHSDGGLTSKDTAMAAEIDGVIAAM